MKKLISILLVAMLIIGMFPATALTAFAATEIVFELGANGSASHNDGSSVTTYSETVDGYTLSITNGTKMYKNARDAKGNSCIKLGTSSVVGSFKFTVPSDVTGVKIAVAKYKSNTTKIKINDTSYTVSKASNNGEYDVYEVNTLSAKTVTFTTVSGGVRAMVNTITFVVDSGTSCDHSLTETVPGVEPTCTEPGVEEAQSCVCGENKVGGAVIPALGHAYANGICANCKKAMVDPAAPTATLLTQLPGIGDTVAIYYPVDSMAMTATADGSKLAGILAELQDGEMPYNDDVAQLTFGAEGEYYTFATADGKYLVTGATGNNLSFADELTDAALWSITASGTNTWNITNKAAIYNNQAQAIEYYNGFTTYGISTSNPIYRMALYLIAESVCEHTNKTSQEDGFDATCTEPGQEDSYVCDDCGANFPGATIDPLGHNYVNGTCTGCGAEKPAGMEPATELVPGQYVIVAHTEENGSFALPTAISGKMSGVKVVVDGELLIGTEDEIDLPLWTIEACGNGVALTNGTKYLGYGTSGTDLTSKDTAYEWTVNGGQLTSATTTNRGVIFQVIDNNKKEQLRFGAYATSNTDGYVKDLTFYKYEPAAEEPPVVEMGGKQYSSFEEAYEEDPDTTIKLLTHLENITVTGDLYLDLNGFNATNISANAIFAYDGSVNVETADADAFGVLTTSSDVEMDYTVNGVRYIALNDGNNYTFHVLQMKLNTVTLRTNAAGIYYKATVICDPFLAAAADTYGVALSTRNLPGNDFAQEKLYNGDVNGWTSIKNEGEKALTGKADAEPFTSGSVFNIFKGDANDTQRGEIKIYANAYLDLGNGRIVMASNDNWDTQAGTAWSLKDVMEKLDDATLTSDQQTLIADFYAQWKNAMTDWDLENIPTWTPSTAA